MSTSTSASSKLFGDCFEQHKGVTDAVLLCVTEGLENRSAQDASNTKSWFLILAGALVFLMQLGFAMLCAGCVRRKNISNTLLKNVMDACGAAIAFFAVGYALAFGGDDPNKGFTFVGNDSFFLTGNVDFGLWFFQYTFSAASVTIIAGTLAERCRMAAYISYSIFMTGFVYPVVAHSIWSVNGFLSKTATHPFMGSGVIDFAGGGVVHLTGGATALVATYVLGARKGRFEDVNGTVLAKAHEIPGHSVALQVMGTMILWFGWYGFNSGSALLLEIEETGNVAALAAVNTSMAAACGALSSLLTNMYFETRSSGELGFDLTKCLNGALAGLVASTSSCGVVYPWAAAVIGICAGWVYLASSHMLVRFKLDDAVDGIPIHMFCAIWGLLAVGFLAAPGPVLEAYGSDAHVGWFYSLGRGSTDATLLLNQFIAVVFISFWAIGLMVPFFMFLSYINWLRADALEEIAGLDASYKHATQEDNEELKKQIVAEYRKHKEATSLDSPSLSVRTPPSSNRRELDAV